MGKPEVTFGISMSWDVLDEYEARMKKVLPTIEVTKVLKITVPTKP